MRRAAECCDVFVTLDRNIEFQQNISILPFGVVVVRAASSRMVHLLPLASAILLAVDAVKPGQLQKVGHRGFGKLRKEAAAQWDLSENTYGAIDTRLD